MNIYRGLVPYPNPESRGFELRDNVPFATCLTILRRGIRMKDRQSALAADPEGRCFRIFRLEWLRLQVAFGKLSIGNRISGKWVFVRRGPAFGVVMLCYRTILGDYRSIPINSKPVRPSNFITGEGGVRS